MRICISASERHENRSLPESFSICEEISEIRLFSAAISARRSKRIFSAERDFSSNAGSSADNFFFLFIRASSAEIFSTRSRTLFLADCKSLEIFSAALSNDEHSVRDSRSSSICFALPKFTSLFCSRSRIEFSCSLARRLFSLRFSFSSAIFFSFSLLWTRSFSAVSRAVFKSSSVFFSFAEILSINRGISENSQTISSLAAFSQICFSKAFSLPFNSPAFTLASAAMEFAFSLSFFRDFIFASVGALSERLAGEG